MRASQSDMQGTGSRLQVSTSSDIYINSGRWPGSVSSTPESISLGLAHIFSFLIDSAFSDLTLHYGAQSFRVHKIILSNQSRWVSRVLEEHFKESDELILRDD
ncbi:hypothetical protein V2W45_1408247 [Cenococcum geophilum]